MNSVQVINNEVCKINIRINDISSHATELSHKIELQLNKIRVLKLRLVELSNLSELFYNFKSIDVSTILQNQRIRDSIQTKLNSSNSYTSFNHDNSNNNSISQNEETLTHDPDAFIRCTLNFISNISAEQDCIIRSISYEEQILNQYKEEFERCYKEFAMLTESLRHLFHDLDFHITYSKSALDESLKRTQDKINVVSNVNAENNSHANAE